LALKFRLAGKRRYTKLKKTEICPYEGEKAS
jgi:hypothetical protein